MSPDNQLESRVRQRLADLLDADLMRTMRPPHGVDFSSNDYLQLSTHAAVVAAFSAGVTAEGAGSTGSRLLRGEREAFDALERHFAAFVGAERALFFSSGFLANLAVLSTVPEAGDVIFSDALNHASLIDGVRMSKASRVVFAHNDPADLERLIAATPCAGQRFVVVESLFSMDGDEAPLAEYARICHDTGSTLIVDEAHAVGLFGERGSGLVEESGINRAALITVSPAGKALGVGGALVAGPAWAIDYLIQRARTFVFSTAAPPAVAHALIAAVDVIHSEPWRRALLLERASRLRARLADLGVTLAQGRSHIIPVHIGPNDTAMAVATTLQHEGFDVRAVRPPTVPVGTSRLRVSVNIGVDDSTLERFAVRLASALKEAGICSAASS